LKEIYDASRLPINPELRWATDEYLVDRFALFRPIPPYSTALFRLIAVVRPGFIRRD
jgi:hypothetical protein